MIVVAPGQCHAHFCELCMLPWICGEEHPRCARPWLIPHPGDAGRAHAVRLPLQTAAPRSASPVVATHVA